DGVYYEYYEPYFEQAELVKNVYQDAYHSWDQDLKLTGQNLDGNLDDKQEHWLPWIYYQFRFDSSFKNWLEKITDWADVVILEYPFWGLMLGNMCKRKNVKLILTAHDVLAKNLPLETQLGQIALGEELQALKKADQVVTLTPDDQTFFANYNIESYCIPISIDTQKIQSDLGANNSLELATILGIEESQIKPICLFVGSQHSPNIEAVKQIRQWSQSRLCDFYFVVVGNCWEPERTKNFLALGRLSENNLVTLYRQSALILAPLTEGTGMSVKTLEALAYGKVLLGTAIAFRGYPVESGKNCLIYDNLDDYPDKINQLIQQPELLKNLGQQAKEFSRNYDYRQLYKGYLDLIL
ncbi:MAG: glycosyltransferase family 4 protein, partial [Microcystaceae cyanobacterium]